MTNVMQVAVLRRAFLAFVSRVGGSLWTLFLPGAVTKYVFLRLSVFKNTATLCTGHFPSGKDKEHELWFPHDSQIPLGPQPFLSLFRVPASW